jgi:trehalose 2-sulfotransferase
MSRLKYGRLAGARAVLGRWEKPNVTRKMSQVAEAAAWPHEAGRRTARADAQPTEIDPGPAGAARPAGTDRPAGAGGPAGTDGPAGNDRPSGTDRPAGTDRPSGTDGPAGTGDQRRPERIAAAAPGGGRSHPRTSYLVCSLPRSGSWLLGFALEDTGLAGHPYPFFCPRVMDYCTATWLLPPDAPIQHYIDAVIKNSMTPNGVLGVKIEWSDLLNLLDLARAGSPVAGRSERQILEELLGDVRIIYLERRDKLREVVSFCRALETREWSQPAGGQGGWPGGAPDFGRLDEFFDLLTAEDREWQEFFRRNGYEPLVVEYEEYTRNQDTFASAIRRVLGYLGIAVPDGFVPPQPRQQRQADEVTEEVVGQYRAWRARKGLAGQC